MAINYTDAAYLTEKSAIERRRKLIEALMGPAQKQTMAGNMAVPLGPFDALSDVLASYIGRKSSDKLDEKAKANDEKYQGEMSSRLAEGLKNYDQARTPQAAQPPMTPNDDEGNPMPGLPAHAGDSRAANLALIQSNHPLLQQMGTAAMLAQDKRDPWSKVDPKDYTPESIAAFGATQDYTKLQPRVKGEAINQGDRTGLFDPYTGKPIGQPIPIAKRDFTQVGGKNVLVDQNALPLGTTLDPGITAQQQQQLAISRAHLGNDNARTFYETGIGGGAVPGASPAGPPSGGFVTRPQPAGAPATPGMGLSPRDQSAVTKQGFEAGLQMLQKEGEQLAGLQDTENLYKRWIDLNKSVSTGPVAGRRPISFDPKFQEMGQIESKLATSDFKPGQGQISNFERQLFKGSGPNRLNEQLTNENIANIRLGAVQNTRDRLNYKQWYLQQNGNLLGADKAWQDYLDQNPRFVTDEKKNVIPNDSRVDYGTYFTLQKRGAEPLPVDHSTMQIDPKKLKKGQWYITPRGAGKWDGTKFLEEGEG